MSTNRIKTILNFWAIKNLIKRRNLEHHHHHIAVLSLHRVETLKEKQEKRYELSKFLVGYLYEKSRLLISEEDKDREEVLVEFSVLELKAAYERELSLFAVQVSVDDVEDALFYLSKIEAIKIEGGFLVVYNRLTIERLEQDNKVRYKVEDYKKLNQFYESKIQQIHIVGEYAKKMITDYKNALQFVEDYFQLNYQSFLNKYFKGSRQNEIRRNVTPAKFQQLFGELSPTQLKIINDNDSRYIVVAAGPGSGKTRVLVHKLASLLLMEDVKHEQLLMLTFSRAAVTEFKKRLLKLIGNAANYIEIKTFHSYCFDLLGKVGSLEKSDMILKKTIEKIRNQDVEASRITKTVLVIDEAQDMDEDEFYLVKALMEHNEEMRVIAVGDDDQNIYEFRGASSQFLERFLRSNRSVKHELVENYRSKSNLVEFTNQYVSRIQYRLKETPVIAKQLDSGRIKVVQYHGGNLTTPVVRDLIASELRGATCVLTKTNEEAMQIAGLLLKNKIPAKLIQSNDSFNLFNLLEVRFFLQTLKLDEDTYIIPDEDWEHAKRELVNRYHTSTKLEICKNIIRDFEATNPKRKYKTDLEVFIRESRLEDFYNENAETVFVSTIHKAKGKEFDQVFLMLENFDESTDAAKRQLYVAMTRAKQNLSIHLNGHFLDTLITENLERINDRERYLPPTELTMQLSYKDIWLDFFINRQHLITQLTCGEHLTVNGSECLNSNGQCVLKFSQKFIDHINGLKEKNYVLKSARVNFIVYWLKEGAEHEVKVVLPELEFGKVEG